MLHACFYTICLVFRYNSWHFYAFSRTNLLTRCHSVSSLFSAVLCFRTVTQEIFSELDETKARSPDIHRSFQKTKEETEPSQRAATPPGGVAWPWPAPACGVGPRSTSDAAPSPIKTPRWEKPKHPITFPETHRDPPPSLTRDREGPEALLGTLPERGIITGGLLHRHACLRRDE
jgi:hypothetical protein